ncbi:hypothetical protein CERZMDRAFT_98278 [Cercospora zeae-maydis SCOH1-5]|uniref:MJ1316 RNA cyclic group end recognition domain-containing protein n=1 Tax=Cercospora zeae-maydis SCOH1-5 TaxID=717836 RepID=A0A6A6FEM3_9PEZI|nr:hypothetical protein CERZMDRAFT_98278 [Cercospora zeae-maydis SCOH1-5]
MAVLQNNDKYWVGLELHVRAFAKRLDCVYLPYPLGSKKPMQEPKPSLPTEKHLYMSLPHAIGTIPPVHTYSLIAVATMSARTFFEYAVEKLGIDLATPPTDDDEHLLIELESPLPQKPDEDCRIICELRYCRVTHEYSQYLSAPENIPLMDWLFNSDLLAQLHDTRYVIKKMRELDATADATQTHAPSSVEYRACVHQLILWAFYRGILCPRLQLLTSEMILFCVDRGCTDLDIREADKYMSKSTIAKLLERCMYPLVLGMNAKSAQLFVPTPSGRILGCSSVGKDSSPVATHTIRRAITEDMTSVATISLGIREGLGSFQSAYAMYLKITLRYWSYSSGGLLGTQYYQILLLIQDELMDIFNAPIISQIWPFNIVSPEDVPEDEGWVSYIGIDGDVLNSRQNFHGPISTKLNDAAMQRLNDVCNDHSLLRSAEASIEIQLYSQEDLFGTSEHDIRPNRREGMDFKAILGEERMATINLDLSRTVDEFILEAEKDKRANPARPSTPEGCTPSNAGPPWTGSNTAPVPQERRPDSFRALARETLRWQDAMKRLMVGGEDSAFKNGDLPPTTESVQHSPPSSTPSGRFRSASHAMRRLKWDPKHQAVEYEVGYVDRFDGMMWKRLDHWQMHTEEEDFIPEHRIWIIRRVRGHTMVWDREKRTDRTGEDLGRK